VTPVEARAKQEEGRVMWWTISLGSLLRVIAGVILLERKGRRRIDAWLEFLSWPYGRFEHQIQSASLPSRLCVRANRALSVASNARH
jgi:hypothetical protein